MSSARRLPREDLQRVLGQVGGAWTELRGGRILLTGASGLFGSWLLETLLHADDELGLGVEVLAPTRSVLGFRERLPHLACDARVRALEHDVRALPAPDGSIDWIIYSLVPSAGTPLSEMEAHFATATGRLLKIADEKRSRSFLLCSTGAVYRPKSIAEPFREDDELHPADGPISYGRIRRQVEDLCLDACSRGGTALKIARGFSFAGPRLPLEGSFAFGNFLRDALAGRPVLVKGDGRPVRSYMHMADLAGWLWRILLDDGAPTVINAGSEEPLSIACLAGKIAGLHGVPVVIENASMPGAAPSWYVPSTSRARGATGLPAPMALEETIAKSARWASGS